MKRSARLAQKLLSTVLSLLLAFAATGLAEDPPTPAPPPSAEPTAASVSESEAPVVTVLSTGDIASPVPADTGTSTPGAETTTPEADSGLSASDVPSPASDSPSPASDTPSPASDSPPPASDTPSPASDSPSPASDTPSPASDTPPPASDTPAPTGEPTPPPPVCELPDCPHVTVDEEGTATALCPLGEWMLAHPEAMTLPLAGGIIGVMDASLPTDIALPATGSYTLYRSGTYTLTGGGPGCQLIVSDNCLVALNLDNVQIGTLLLGARCVADLTFQGSAIGALFLPDDASLKLLGEGSLTVGALGPNTRDVTVAGGSVSLPAGITSVGGALEFSFPAPGSTGVTVGGKAYPYTQPCPDDKAHLWLPPLGDGQAYVAAMSGTILEITVQEEAPTPSDSYDLFLSDSFTAVAGRTFTITQTGPALPQTLLVNAPDVTLMMNGVSAASAPVDVEFTQDGTLHLSGGNDLHTLGGAAKASLTGSGSLSLDSLNVGSLSLASGMTLTFGSQSGVLDGWYPLAVPGVLTADTKTTLDGKPMALAFSTADPSTALLPKAPASGMAYSATLSGNTLSLQTIPLGEQSLVLTDAGLTIDWNGTYRITTNGPTGGMLTIAPKVKATITLVGLESSSSLAIGGNAQVTLILEQSSTLGGGITMGQGSALVVQGSGALLTSGITKSEGGLVDVDIKSPANLTLPAPGPIAGSALLPTVLFISDSHGAALPNTRIVLKLGKNTPFSITTNKNGFIYLWRSAPLSNTDAVVLSDADTYATVLVGGSGDPDALPVISGVTVNASGTVTYAAPGAATSGIQFYINRSGIDMPDTYLGDAGRILQHLGECNIPGLQEGDLVIFRVFACAQANVELTAETADAFAFSPQFSFVASGVRFPFTLAAQSKTYNGKKFAFASGLLPRGVSVTWFSGSQPLGEAPTQVGRYTAKISIPPGHPDFLPGVTDVSVDILPILVLIRPEGARKVMGEPDPPEFPYTYDVENMLHGDEVTGNLTRLPGEKPGNYPFLADALVAKPYYQLKIDPSAPMFFIDFNPHHFMPFDPLARIDPVHDILLFSDGRKLDLITATVKKLNISGVGYGELVADEDSGKTRPFTPSLRLRPGYDAALLILQAEPELREDGGYVTDLDGNPVVTGRTLTLTYSHLASFRRQRITHIAFGLRETYCYLALEELDGEAVRALMAREGIPRLGSRFSITLRPVTAGTLSENTSAAKESAALQAPLALVCLELVNGSRRVDITPALASAQLLMDVSPVLDLPGKEAQSSQAEVVETVIGQGRETQPTAQEPEANPQGQALQEASDTLEGRVEPTTQSLELARQTLEKVLAQRGCILSFFTDLSNPLDSLLVVPYTFSEAQAISYTAILRTRPYLMASLATHGNGLYGLAFADPSVLP